MARVEVVEWDDASFQSEVHESDEMIGGLHPLISIGWFVREDDEVVVLAQERAPDDPTAVRFFISIPKSCITHRRRLAVKIDGEAA